MKFDRPKRWLNGETAYLKNQKNTTKLEYAKISVQNQSFWWFIFCSDLFWDSQSIISSYRPASDGVIFYSRKENGRSVLWLGCFFSSRVEPHESMILKFLFETLHLVGIFHVLLSDWIYAKSFCCSIYVRLWFAFLGMEIPSIIWKKTFYISNSCCFLQFHLHFPLNL